MPRQPKDKTKINSAYNFIDKQKQYLLTKTEMEILNRMKENRIRAISRLKMKQEDKK